MKIRSISNKALRRFVGRDDPAGLPPACVERLRNMISYLSEMRGPEELAAFPHWRPHRLTGARKGAWALSVTPNWRLTFKIDEKNNEITDLNFEDYH